MITLWTYQGVYGVFSEIQLTEPNKSCELHNRHGKLFYKKKGVMRCVFVCNSEMFWIVRRRLKKKRVVLLRAEAHWQNYVFCRKHWGAPLSFLLVSCKNDGVFSYS